MPSRDIEVAFRAEGAAVVVRGSAAPAFSLARRLAGILPLRLEAADRPLRAQSPPLSAKMPLADAFRLIVGECLGQMLANQAVLADHADPEAVHQMRVALRRLRSAARLFRDAATPPPWSEDVRWLADSLAPARDSTVLLDEIVAPAVAALPADPRLAALRQSWAGRCRADLGTAVAAAADPRFTLAALGVAEWGETGFLGKDHPRLKAFARQALAQGERRLRHAVGDDVAVLSAPDLHRARIRGKRLRYTGEFFAALFPAKAARPVLHALAGLQDRLGRLNDLAVAEARLVTDEHAAAVVAWHAARRPELTAAAAAAWSRWIKAGRFWE